MKDKYLYAILGAVYLSPHMSTAVGIGCGVWMVACSLYEMWREA